MLIVYDYAFENRRMVASKRQIVFDSACPQHWLYIGSFILPLFARPEYLKAVASIEYETYADALRED
jgi:hypothetical protein